MHFFKFKMVFPNFDRGDFPRNWRFPLFSEQYWLMSDDNFHLNLKRASKGWMQIYISKMVPFNYTDSLFNWLNSLIGISDSFLVDICSVRYRRFRPKKSNNDVAQFRIANKNTGSIEYGHCTTLYGELAWLNFIYFPEHLMVSRQIMFLGVPWTSQ
jgi:hypothetical protein